MSRLRLCSPRDTPQKDIFQFKELEACSHVFLRRIAIAPRPTAPYNGPYKVISRGGRVMKILLKGKVETVSIYHIKPTHFECEPETGTEIKRKMQPKTTNSKTAGIARGTRRDRIRSSSTFTPKFVRTGVKPNMSTKTKSSRPKVGPAITLQSPATRAHLPRQPTPYKVPHSRTPTFLALTGTATVCKCANVYLIRGKTLDQNNTDKHTDVRSITNIAYNDKVISDNSVKQTRAGCKIHTPSQFVQMVHAVVAPNDIYGGTNSLFLNHYIQYSLYYSILNLLIKLK